MRPILLPGETRRDLLSRAASDPGTLIGSLAGDPGDAKSLAKDGLKLVGICKQQADMMERRHASPIPIYGQAFSRDGWRQVEAILARKARKAPEEALRVRYEAAAKLAKRMPAEASPWDAMVAMYDIWFNTKLACVDGVARALMRDACYTVTMAFAGRK